MLTKIVKKRRQTKASRIKYLLITNPNNPTGTVLSKQALEEVVEIANENGILLISDEIYDEILFKGAEFTSIGELAKGIPHVILNGASKAFDATGFRIGYVMVPEHDAWSEELKRKLVDYCRVRLCANTPAQYAIAEAMNNKEEHRRTINRMVGAIEENVDTVMKLLEENPFLKAVRPGGAFYVLPKIDMRHLNLKDDKDFVGSLLREELIQTTRGSGFGAPDHFRIVALAPKDLMGDCIAKVNDFCRNTRSDARQQNSVRFNPRSQGGGVVSRSHRCVGHRSSIDVQEERQQTRGNHDQKICKIGTERLASSRAYGNAP